MTSLHDRNDQKKFWDNGKMSVVKQSWALTENLAFILVFVWRW